jgi:hypothetical protein
LTQQSLQGCHRQFADRKSCMRLSAHGHLPRPVHRGDAEHVEF